MSLYIFYRQGFIGGTTFLGVAAIVVCFVALFYGSFRFRLNTRFPEPSLMLPQLSSSLAIMLSSPHLERATQIALAPFILIAFSFGIFRLSTASADTAGGHLPGRLSRHHHDARHGGRLCLRFPADLVQWFVLALTLPGMIVVGKQIQNLHQLLQTTRYQLEHYEEKSVRDELTGLYNRRQIQAELEQAKLQADTRSVHFSICLIDIDHFKEINDNNGHLAGDTVLKEFAKVARDSFRDTDMLGRYGGDEFLQILPDTDLKGAVMHAERLRVYTHFLDFQKLLGQKSISLSIGVAQYRKAKKSPI